MMKQNKGITLISLVITIVVMLILTSVTINMTVNGGLFSYASEANFKAELTQAKEEFELFKLEKMLDDVNFNEESLNIGQNTIDYNTKPEGATGKVETVFAGTSEKHRKNIEVIKGQMYYKTTKTNQIKWLQDIGITPNPYDIENGVLLSSNNNLLLMDNTGTLRLPESVEAIDTGAFSNVEGLKTIIIPGSCKTIRTDAFSNNQTLEKVIMEEGVEIIETKAFKKCTALTDVTMANTVISLGVEAFYSDTALKNINLSTSLTEIPMYTFYRCLNLANINIPDTIKKIYPNAFSQCPLQEITISKNMIFIDTNAFHSCKQLNIINIEEGNSKYTFSNGILLEDNNNEKEMIFISPNAVSGSTFIVPNGVKTLTNQLGGYSNITKVIIPASVDDISGGFFTEYMTQVEISQENATYEVIDNSVYTKSSENKKLVKYFGNEETVTIPEGVKTIGSYAFRYQINISSLILPNSLQKIENSAFVSCNLLTNLSLGENINNLSATFLYDSGITTLNIDSKNTYYKVQGEFLLSYDGTKIITIIDPLRNKTSVTIPTGVVEIVSYAFNNQSKLTSVTIPNTVTKIGDSFQNCTSLTSIEFPASVETIGSSCFNGCTNLTEIIINNKKNAIAGAPWGCNIGDRGIVYRITE